MKNTDIQRGLVTLFTAASLVGCSGEVANNSQTDTNPESNAVPTLTVDPSVSQEGEYDHIPGLIPYYNVDAVSAIKLMSPDEQEWIYDTLTIEHPYLKYNTAVLNFNKGQLGEMNIPIGRLFINGMGSIVKHDGKYIFATNSHVLDGSYDKGENGFFIKDGINIVVGGIGIYAFSPQRLELLGGSEDAIYYLEFPEEMQVVLNNMEQAEHAIYPQTITPNLSLENNSSMYYFDSVSHAVVPIKVDSSLGDKQVHFIALSDSEIDMLDNPLKLEFTYHPMLCGTFSGSGVVQEISVNGNVEPFYVGGISERDDTVRYNGRVIAGRNISCTPINPEGISEEELKTISGQLGAGITLGGVASILNSQQ